MLSGEGDTDFEGDADTEDSDDNIDLFKEKRYEKTKSEKLDEAQKQRAREGDSSNPVHRVGRVLLA
jgi:hypothetical protein